MAGAAATSLLPVLLLLSVTRAAEPPGRQGAEAAPALSLLQDEMVMHRAGATGTGSTLGMHSPQHPPHLIPAQSHEQLEVLRRVALKGLFPRPLHETHIQGKGTLSYREELHEPRVAGS